MKEFIYNFVNEEGLLSKKIENNYNNVDLEFFELFLYVLSSDYFSSNFLNSIAPLQNKKLQINLFYLISWILREFFPSFERVKILKLFSINQNSYCPSKYFKIFIKLLLDDNYYKNFHIELEGWVKVENLKWINSTLIE